MLAVRNGNVGVQSMPPPLGVAFGYTKLKKFIGFSGSSTANIDMANSGAAGFDLYLATAWPNAGQAGSWRTGSVTDNTLISVSNGILNISGFTGTGQFSLATACANGSGYNGFAAPASSLFRIVWQVDPTQASTGHNTWPIFWGQSLKFLLGGLLFVELDIDERFPTGAGAATFDANVFEWTMPGATNIETARNFGSTAGSAYVTTDIMVVEPARNGGTGLIQSALNGVHIAGMDMTFAATGNYASLIGDSFVGLLGCGPTQGINVSNLQFWGP